QSIGTVDADGVALAAIQGLNQKLEARSQQLEARSQGVEARMRRLEAALKEREAENARLREAVTELQALVRALAAQDNERAR
ncbi:MAG: hypothetical protein RMK20_12910, partial [Verrucomicrobiales bacterium]|nr:hypothetical protein [Verrucomicrobiales bacterium]